MKNSSLKACSIGLGLNLCLFFIKLYIGISSFSLTIYCDAINNLGDTFACGICVFGFLMIKRLNETKSARAQSLCTFVVSILIAATGIIFVYNGLQRLMYPVPIVYYKKYAVVLFLTIIVKILMGAMYTFFNKKETSPVLKALRLDCFLDCFVTLTALIGLVLTKKINYAVDGVFAIIIGLSITVSAVKNIIYETKFLINN